MSYRLKRRESVQRGLKRIVKKTLGSAVDSLEHATRRQHDDAVHTARKSVKKARAVVSMVDDRLEGASPDKALRQAGNKLSLERDADILAETFDRLRRRYPAKLRGSAL